jgi:glycosyltransferase involved in cell wall biosynthesis
MKQSNVDVSVVLPVHGEAPFLIETLNSIEIQDCNELEIELILVLDRPSIEVKELINAAKERFKNCVVVQSNAPGIVSALNTGISISSGRFIARIDSDDRMHSSRIQSQYKILSSNKELDCLGSQVCFIDETGQKIGKSYYPHKSKDIGKVLPFRNCLAHPSVMYRKSAILKIGSYSPNTEGCEDYDLWLRLFNGRNIVNIGAELTEYRVWPKQMTQTEKVLIANRAKEVRSKNSDLNVRGKTAEKRLKSRIRSSELIDKCFDLVKTNRGPKGIPSVALLFLRALALDTAAICSFSVAILKARIYR